MVVNDDLEKAKKDSAAELDRLWMWAERCSG